MSYIKTSWVARVGTALNRFLKSNESSGSVELTNDPTGVTTAGTPFTVANMNKIEQGIYDAHEAITANTNQGMILTQWTNTTTKPDIASGSYISHGGVLYLLDTLTSVDAPVADGFYYLKVVASGGALTLSWVASTSGYIWDVTYNGLYHTDGSQILPYVLEVIGAVTVFNKGKIINLMQGSGFVTVDYVGTIVGKLITGDSIIVTGAIAGASVDTGHGANEVYRMSQEVLAFGSVHDETKTEYISDMISGEVRFVNITASLTGSGAVVVRIEVKLPNVGTYDVVGIGGALVAETIVYANETLSASKTVNACIVVRRI